MGFSNPAAWLLSPLFAVLVALYLWEQQRRQVDVPSLLLWEAVPDAVVRTSRFRPDLLFYLQLLVLTLLILGFARPYRSISNGANAGERHIFVLDTSASMQAREEGGSRFDQARDALLQRISNMSGQDEAMLISAASYPRVVVPLSRDRANLERHLRSLRPVDTGTQLEPALALARRAAARGDRPTRIELFTDVSASRLEPAWKSDVTVFQVGRSDDNLAIEGLEIFQGRLQDPSEASARVTLHNFSHRNEHGFLSIRLNGEVLSRRGFSLSAGELQSFSMNDFPHSGVVHATLEVNDALTVDNDAYGWVRPLRQIDLVVVSDTLSLRADLERIERSVSNLRVHFLSPSEYRAHSSTAADVILFDGYVPAEIPPCASLYVFPNRSGPWFSVKGSEHSLPVLNWQEGHPALGTLRPQLAFPLSNVRIVQLPKWADVLVSSSWRGRAIPLVFVGEHGGRRLAGISFDLAAEHMLRADNVNLVLLFAGLLEWLLPSDSHVVLQRTGEIHTFQSKLHRPARIIDPLGRAEEFRPGDPLRIELLHAGEYRVETDENRNRLYANFIDPVESDIGREAEGTSVSVQPVTVRSRVTSGKKSFDAWFYALAALFLIVEWMVAVRR